MENDISLERTIDSVNTGLDAIKRAPIVDENTGIKCLRIQDVSQKKEYSNWGFTDVSPDNYKKFQLKENDILIARTGGSIGVNKFIFQDQSAVYNNGLIRIRVNSKEYSPKFIFFLLQSDSFKAHIDAIAYSTSAQPNMKIRDLLRFEFKNIDLPEQKTIAHILGSLDDKIELNRQMNETLEAMAQALFKSWFVDFDPVLDNAIAACNTIPDVLQERAAIRKQVLAEQTQSNPYAKHFPNEFEFTEELGWIPKGWSLSNIESEFDVIMGQSPPGSSYNETGEGIYFYQGSTDFGFRYPTPRIYCTEPKRIAKKGDTLVSVRAPVGDINIALDECCIGRGLAAVKHKSSSESFTYYSMNQLKKNFEIYEGEGTVFGSINQKDFKALKQIKFPNDLISIFHSNIGGFDNKIELNSKEISVLSKLRDILLPQLLSGKLRIPDAEKMVAELGL